MVDSWFFLSYIFTQSNRFFKHRNYGGHMVLVLAGDIGGTKTVLGIFDNEKNIKKPIYKKSFSCNKYSSLEEILNEFMEQVGVKVKVGTLAVAGPVRMGKSEITNLPWRIEEKAIADKNRIDNVKLLNDLQSLAYFIPSLDDSDLEVLYPGDPISSGNIAVIAPGTGLGEAFLTWDGEKYHAYASEGGHTDFPPLDSVQRMLLKGIGKKTGGRVSLERVCSGIGIKNIYTYLKESKYAEEPDWLTKKLTNAEDPVSIIVNTALFEKGRSELCDTTFNTFISILGTEVGNLGLKVMATNGIYLGGGIPPKILPALKSEEFLKVVHNKGRMTSLIRKMPIKVILNQDSCLLGAAQYSIDYLNRLIS